MLVGTLKNVLKHFQAYAKSNRYKLEVIGIQTKYNYSFTILKSKIEILITGSEPSMMLKPVDIEMVTFEDNDFQLVSVSEVSFDGGGGIYEESLTNIKYEAQLFIKLFRIMKERVTFTFEHDGKYYNCNYIDGKVYYVEEDDKTYTINGTDLYKLGTTHDGYRILVVSSPKHRRSNSEYMEAQHLIAQKLGKEFKKMKYNVQL